MKYKVYKQSTNYTCGPASYLTALINNKISITELKNLSKKPDLYLHEIGRIKPALISLSPSFIKYENHLKKKKTLSSKNIKIEKIYSTGKIRENSDAKYIILFFELGEKMNYNSNNWKEIGKKINSSKTGKSFWKKFKKNYEKGLKNSKTIKLSIDRFLKLIESLEPPYAILIKTIYKMGKRIVPVPHWVFIAKKNRYLIVCDPSTGKAEKIIVRKMKSNILELYKIGFPAEIVKFNC